MTTCNLLSAFWLYITKMLIILDIDRFSLTLHTFLYIDKHDLKDYSEAVFF